jgi:hypothetical protein
MTRTLKEQRCIPRKVGFGAWVKLMELHGDLTSDVIILESEREFRLCAPGHYSLANHWDARGKPKKFACRAVSISETAVALAAPVAGKIGAPVAANIEHLGRIEGRTLRPLSQGFVMSIIADTHLKLTEKIDWLEKRGRAAASRRAHVRFAPTEPRSRIMLADGTNMPCFVLDLCEGGAAVSTDPPPPIGTILAVGKIVGRVVRCFVGGFAVQFTELQTRERVETLAIVNGMGMNQS